MTREEANREADRRWGPFARSVGCLAIASPRAFSVGISRGRDLWVLGEGKSWEEAFEAAAKRTPTEDAFTKWRDRVRELRGSTPD